MTEKIKPNASTSGNFKSINGEAMPDKDITFNLTPQFDQADLADAPDVEPITAAEIVAEVKGRLTKKPNLFLIRTAAQCIEDAKTRPIPKMLFGEFWHEGELCILFADTNQGKSILAVQIAESISIGKAIPGFRLEAEAQRVLYFDFELNDKQFEARYSSKYTNHYIFDNRLYRLEVNPDAVIPPQYEGDFETYLNDSLEAAVIDRGAKILVIDNLTYLKNETERAKDALPLMKHLKALKSKYGLSILAIAHTPKRDLSKPITRNDLQGSKMLINFCDSCFAIGESHTDKNARYLKQIKARNTEILYDTDNVCVCQVDKPTNFLQFDFVNFGKEWDHLKQPTDKEKEDLSERVLQLNQQGRSLREIGAELGVSHMKVKRILAEPNPKQV